MDEAVKELAQRDQSTADETENMIRRIQMLRTKNAQMF